MLRVTTAVLALVFATAASAQTQVPSNSRLKTIASTKVVKVAYRTDARPFSFVNNNQPVGYSIDLCKLVVTSIERQLNVGNLKIESVPRYTSDAILSGGEREGRHGNCHVKTTGNAPGVTYAGGRAQPDALAQEVSAAFRRQRLPTAYGVGKRAVTFLKKKSRSTVVTGAP